MLDNGEVWGMTRPATKKGGPKLISKGAALPQQDCHNGACNGFPCNHACYSFVCVGRRPKAV